MTEKCWVLTYQEWSFYGGGVGGERWEGDAHCDRFVELPSPGLHRDDRGHGAPLLGELQGVARLHLHQTQPHTDLLGQRLPGEITLQAGADWAADVAAIRPNLQPGVQ